MLIFHRLIEEEEKLLKNAHNIKVLILGMIVGMLLASGAVSNFVGSVSARYAKKMVFGDTVVIPKNYYTVTYFQHDGTELQTVKEYKNISHSLYDGTNVSLPSGAESFEGWVNALGDMPDLTKREDYSKLKMRYI